MTSDSAERSAGSAGRAPPARLRALAARCNFPRRCALTPACQLRGTASLALLAAASATSIAAAAGTGYKGRACTPPSGHRIVDCRLAKHGTPDLSRAAWRALRGAEVTFSERIDDLSPNPDAGGARDWPLIDSLGLPIGRLVSGGARPFTVAGDDGTPYRVTSVRVRGRGCAAERRPAGALHARAGHREGARRAARRRSSTRAR